MLTSARIHLHINRSRHTQELQDIQAIIDRIKTLTKDNANLLSENEQLAPKGVYHESSTI